MSPADRTNGRTLPAARGSFIFTFHFSFQIGLSLVSGLRQCGEFTHCLGAWPTTSSNGFDYVFIFFFHLISTIAVRLSAASEFHYFIFHLTQWSTIVQSLMAMTSVETGLDRSNLHTEKYDLFLILCESVFGHWTDDTEKSPV